MYIDQLHNDHINTSTLLSLLDREMSVFDRGDRPDFSLMQAIVDYMCEYTETIHHPLEDLAYAALVKRDPSYSELVEGIEAEHKELLDLTKAFTLTLEEIVLESVMSRDAISSQGHEYIRRNREHINKEETQLFPAIRDKLTQADWVEIEPKVKTQDDPLFGSNVMEKYQALYQQITQS